MLGHSIKKTPNHPLFCPSLFFLVLSQWHHHPPSENFVIAFSVWPWLQKNSTLFCMETQYWSTRQLKLWQNLSALFEQQCNSLFSLGKDGLWLFGKNRVLIYLGLSVVVVRSAFFELTENKQKNKLRQLINLIFQKQNGLILLCFTCLGDEIWMGWWLWIKRFHDANTNNLYLNSSVKDYIPWDHVSASLT